MSPGILPTSLVGVTHVSEFFGGILIGDFHRTETNFIFSVNVPRKEDLKKAVVLQASEFVVYLL